MKTVNLYIFDSYSEGNNIEMDNEYPFPERKYSTKDLYQKFNEHYHSWTDGINILTTDYFVCKILEILRLENKINLLVFYKNEKLEFEGAFLFGIFEVQQKIAFSLMNLQNNSEL